MCISHALPSYHILYVCILLRSRYVMYEWNLFFLSRWTDKQDHPLDDSRHEITISTLEDIAISTPLVSFREGNSTYTRRLRLYELQRKEPLYNPRWPPPRRGLLLANTKQEAPPWLTARDGMIYWDFCLFAPALQRTHRA